MKKKTVPLILSFLCAFCVMLTACSKIANTDIQFTTGLQSDELFKIGKAVCKTPEAMIYLVTQKNIYESAYGPEIWGIELTDGTFEDNVKISLKNFLAQLKCMNLMAQEYKITLSDSEIKTVKEASAAYYTALSRDAVDSLKVTQDTVELVFREYYTANKVVSELTKDVDTEVSDNDARIIHIQQILLRKYTIDANGKRIPLEDQALQEKRQLAKSILEQAAQGGDFTALAKEYSEEEQNIIVAGRGDLPNEVENVAFSLEKDAVSQIVESDYGFHIIKCLEDYDVAATDEHKIQMGEEKKADAFRQLYDTFTASLSSEFNEKAWKRLSFSAPGPQVSVNFYEIFKQYFGE